MELFYAWSPYIVIFLAVVLVVVLLLWAYNRREARRYRAKEVAVEFSKLGLNHLAEVLWAYVVGDYSGIAKAIHELHQAIAQRGLPSLFDDLFWKLLKAYAADKDRRSRIETELQNIAVVPDATALQSSPPPQTPT